MWTRLARSAGAQATPIKQRPALIPKPEPRALSSLTGVEERKNCLKARKKRINPLPANVSAVVNSMAEAGLGWPLRAWRRPKSLKKFWQNEYPVVVGSASVPPG